jgi:hypothetical protein
MCVCGLLKKKRVPLLRNKIPWRWEDWVMGGDIKELSDGWTERIAGHVRRRVSIFPPLWAFSSFQTRLWLWRRRRSRNEANKRPPLRLDDDESWWWSNAHRRRLYALRLRSSVCGMWKCVSLSSGLWADHFESNGEKTERLLLLCLVAAGCPLDNSRLRELGPTWAI